MSWNLETFLLTCHPSNTSKPPTSLYFSITSIPNFDTYSVYLHSTLFPSLNSDSTYQSSQVLLGSFLEKTFEINPATIFFYFFY